MILKNYGERFTYLGRNYTVGADVLCNSNSVYHGLGGKIAEIRTEDNKDTENPTIDIVVELIPPALPGTIARFEALGVNCMALNEIIMAPCQISIFDTDATRPKITVYTLTESWTSECGSTGCNIYTYTSMEYAMAKLNELYQRELGSIPEDWEIESDETYIERWEDGYHDSNYYKLSITINEIELDSQSIRNIYEFADKQYILEDAKSRLDEEEYAEGLTEGEADALLTDALVERINSSLDKSDSYADAYWSSIDSILKEEIESSREALSVHDYADRMTSLCLFCREKGASLDHRFYDNEHLECLWYDGASVATVEYKNHLICFDVHGDVRLFVEGNHIRHDGGSEPLFKNEICRHVLKNDCNLIKMTREGAIDYSNNNWISIVVFNQETGAEVFESEVASDTNLLKAVENSLEHYFKRIDTLVDSTSLEEEVSQ